MMSVRWIGWHFPLLALHHTRNYNYLMIGPFWIRYFRRKQ